MATPRELIDTYVLVRFFTGEPPPVAARARRLVERADNGELILVVLPVIVAETIYTLESYYEIERKEVAEKLLAFVQSRGIETTEPARIADALQRCIVRNAHFADAYLAASTLELNHSIASFDRDFDKFKDIHRTEPR